jgi:hypothetical protein
MSGSCAAAGCLAPSAGGGGVSGTFGGRRRGVWHLRGGGGVSGTFAAAAGCLAPSAGTFGGRRSLAGCLAPSAGGGGVSGTFGGRWRGVWHLRRAAAVVGGVSGTFGGGGCLAPSAGGGCLAPSAACLAPSAGTFRGRWRVSGTGVSGRVSGTGVSAVVMARATGAGFLAGRWPGMAREYPRGTRRSTTIAEIRDVDDRSTAPEQMASDRSWVALICRGHAPSRDEMQRSFSR